MTFIDFVILAAVAVVIVRNFRKDRSDGRDYLGGSGSGTGGGGGGLTDKRKDIEKH